MPNLDLFTLVKWVIIILIALGLLAAITSALGGFASVGSTANDAAYKQRIDAPGSPTWTDTGFTDASKPTLSNVSNAVVDAILGPGAWATWRGWMGGAVITMLLLAIGWGIWKAVFS